MLRAAALRSGLVVALAVGFLPFGVPRLLAGDDAARPSPPGENVATLCRDHGGTPSPAPGAGTNTGARRFCTVRYGSRVYVMDAITPAGFDDDTARYQRQGCEEARRRQAASNAASQEQTAFVYHAKTGVCERRR